MKIARRAASLAATVAVVGVALVGCSADADTSDQAGGGSSGGATTCVDATLPNATAEELVDVLRPVQVGDADDEFTSLMAQFEEGRAAQVARMQDGEVFKAVPADGDAAFAKSVCAQSRWDDVVNDQGETLASPRSQRAAVVATGHTYCDSFAQLKPSAASTGAWSDWAGYVDMMTQGATDGADDGRQTYAAALTNICPQFA
ncbi:hypothetical protein [Rhodococcus kronopolitis]|uniref:DUF732 domain-containing protein n=1 Tax=Rhodococcus kronopolitis TaxID=1460226 RepID=A0ABV9FML0_9NOCA